MQVISRRCGDEVVILAGSELESAGLRCERAEGDGEVHELVRLVAHGDDARIGVGYAARVVLLLGHVVDDVLLGVVLVRPRRVHRTDDVHLVVLERNVVLVDVDDVIRVVYPEYWVGGVPVDVVEPVGRRRRLGDQVDHQEKKVDDELRRHGSADMLSCFVSVSFPFFLSFNLLLSYNFFSLFLPIESVIFYLIYIYKFLLYPSIRTGMVARKSLGGGALTETLEQIRTDIHRSSTNH